MAAKNINHHLKNWLIAHKDNGHWPHLLRIKGFAAGLVLIVVLQVVFNFTAVGRFQVLGYATDINAAELLHITNNERANHGLQQLKSNNQLNQAATAKAQHMFQHNYWAHVGPDGTQPWYFVAQAGYAYTHAGENLAKDFQTSSGVMAGWMNSGDHRQNILNANYHEIGLAVMNGTLQGSQTTLVVAFYAAPAGSPPPKTQVQPEPVSQPAGRTDAPLPEVADTNENEVAGEAGESEASEPEELSPLAGLNLEPGNHQFAPSETSYGISRPLPMYKTMTMGEKSTVFILSGFLLANTMNHTLIWRKRRTRLKLARHIWFRTHPALQVAVLAIPIIMVLLSGLGTVL